ncbi:MAG TPA: HNH endonuclease domain-containing protein [Bacteroidia bacterium]|nr:HNH endonuclease domain-containing protein [Bacteroidia bacterium]HQW18068.1 HNH endonuclease domain-containing protein [Bacteroidia bacterium]HQW49388.1 HNH endonuclease domain-containing protein [Bacteroidia bacterium]HQX69995.1 HNH endonuclease domain-containing protein [Bacteroidia bacterium]HQZ77449.1 HNH endonuclease domain-containing protein [Bacteroidia bacterium]
MKKILGLDLGTNSIGWALIEQNFDKKEGSVIGMGSRIIPMSQDIKDEFGKGNSVSQTADRTKFRSVRRLRERHLLRRERLHRVLNVLGFLPEHYANDIDFEKHFGKFKDETETKLVWKKNGKKPNGKDKFEFAFQSTFEEMLNEFKKSQPDLLNKKNKKGEEFKIPYDWTIYYLRKKALTQKLAKEELAWLILNFNQKRGYYQLRGEEEEENQNKLVEFHSLKVVEVKAEIKYILTLENNETYYRLSETPLLDWKDTNRDFVVTTYLETDGTVKKDKDGKEKRSLFLKDDLVFIKKKTTKITKSTKNKNETVEEKSIKIIDVKEEKQNEIWYSLILENGWIYRRQSKVSLEDWKGKVREFIVTTDLNDDSSIKTDDEGKESRSFRAPKEDDWTLIKKKTEDDLSKYIGEYKTKNGIDGTVGTYIYDNLLRKPNQKIKGKLVRTIERKFYKYELREILKKQIVLQPELFSDDLYNDCVRELYKNNEAHQLQLNKRDFIHLFLDDIIFYQRPLRSQKSSIGNCSLEFRLHKINKKDDKGNSIKNEFEKDENGKDIEVKEYLKVIPKSNPYYQEFRLWQWLYNLKIYKKEDDTNITADFITSNDDKITLFDFLNSRKEIEQKPLIEFLVKQRELKNPANNNLNKKVQTALSKKIKEETEKYRWNYVEDKKYPCNGTGTQIRTRLERVTNVSVSFLTREIEQHLWHIIYSVTDKNEFEKALKSFSKRHQIDETSFVENFKNFPPFISEYGSLSEKAIKKLLPLLRIGKYWNENAINDKIKKRANSISERLKSISKKEDIENISDDDIQKQILKSFYGLTDLTQGLQLYQASYLIYGRHSEASDLQSWNSVADLEKYLKEFKQHSLRNPIVEQVVTETLRVVKDIWTHYGKGVENFFDEIHVELGREMKNTAEDRAVLTKQVTSNENTNMRIKLLLAELKNDTTIEGVREYSPSQQEILKIYEDGVLNSNVEIPNDISEILKKFKESDIKKQPTKTEVNRYKLWLEQKYRSPYTGQMIPLSKLFTEAYQIEHIIPQSRYFDDSFNNKVICEAAVNQLKDKQLGLEFIKNHSGQIIDLGQNQSVTLFTEQQYTDFVKEHYDKNRSKRTKLLLDEIPDKMIERQLNDTRYISKFISSVLSNIVRANKDDDGVNSKNLLPGNGKITSELRQDWGLNDVWNDLILPRFERMNELSQSNHFTATNKEGHTIPAIPLELSKGFQKKRIDHRHHAMDALVIACATRDHVNLLNNQSAKSDNSRYDLQRKLRKVEKWTDKEGKERDKFTDFYKPWSTFTQDTKNELEKIVVSFKQNLRVINKASNHYEKIINGKKVLVKQEGSNWAIRKPMHKDTVSGLVQLRKTKTVSLSVALENYNDIVDKTLRKHILSLINQNYDKKKLTKYFKDNENKWNNRDISKLDIYYLENDNVASRVNLDISFNKERIEDTITDTGIQKILLKHLINYEGQTDEKGKAIAPETLAFTPEGIDEMNKNIITLNNGKSHQPILKVRTYEPKGNKFTIGETGNKKDKFVEAAKGTNLFFAIYEDENGNRSYETIPLNIVIERQKQGLCSVPEQNEKGHALHFHLSPNDLVYVPQVDENLDAINFGELTIEQSNRIYKFTDGSGIMANFIPSKIAEVIFNINKLKQESLKINYPIQNEIGVGSQGSKNERAISGEQIKSICIKLNIDRLGNITPSKKTNQKSTSSFVNEEHSIYYNKVTFNNLQQSDEKMFMHTANMNPEERMAYLQKLRETTQENISEAEKRAILNQIKINPPDENT